MEQRWDIFCRVVDNFGDIGVCWRLARQLAAEHGLAVRLWVDDLMPFARLCPDIDPARGEQTAAGVAVRRWPDPWPTPMSAAAADEVAAVVIEAFACELPPAYLAAMARRPVAPVWINLEYLSAEDWVEGCHGLTSPHPTLPLTKHFFFPGFTSATGGLLREADYDRRRAGFDGQDLRRRLGLPAALDNPLTVSLFGYENTALPDLLETWAADERPIELLVPEGRLTPVVQAFFGSSSWRRGRLSAHPLPFLPQPEYDELLWLCDLNFVRGEDSFVRAQWAEKPFVWHIYPQADDHHQVKLAAFLDRYLAGLGGNQGGGGESWTTALRRFWWAWESGADAGAAWTAFRVALPSVRAHGRRWSGQLQRQGNLARNLLSFAMESR
ncbi:hypothetical protein B9N43_03330 [Denitratisoma sp. DHT3]|uniref:elongation factor P maturation arginine rhamnosyltransferase EarP n=1 Tax=Denitratisoma sp. DHT3 TaxID=1981880 RepID=UPI0011986B2B|nr:elongation factor P maturation arginine rhamnosyltransferase EarP [Denitratisoma sp. DHT3]QDX80378.1 hypothetical protein B9N43_03330 [Denitratisoma sp. DHT3]